MSIFQVSNPVYQQTQEVYCKGLNRSTPQYPAFPGDVLTYQASGDALWQPGGVPPPPPATAIGYSSIEYGLPVNGGVFLADTTWQIIGTGTIANVIAAGSISNLINNDTIFGTQDIAAIVAPRNFLVNGSFSLRPKTSDCLLEFGTSINALLPIGGILSNENVLAQQFTSGSICFISNPVFTGDVFRLFIRQTPAAPGPQEFDGNFNITLTQLG